MQQRMRESGKAFYATQVQGFSQKCPGSKWNCSFTGAEVTWGSHLLRHTLLENENGRTDSRVTVSFALAEGVA